MSYSKEKILESEMAVDILRIIQDKEDGSYTKELAEELDSSSTSISNVLKTLREFNIIERGKRTKSQYYKINYEGLVDFWYDELENKLSSSKEQVWGSEEFREEEDQIKKQSRRYFQLVLLNLDQKISLNNLLFTSYALSLSNYKYESHLTNQLKLGEDMSDYMKATESVLNHYLDIPDFSDMLSILREEPEDAELFDKLDEM